MYTTHKKQKRKIWHDGLITLYASRKLVVYAVEDDEKTRKVIDETKLATVNWDCKDNEYIETPKFLVEIVNETPVNSMPSLKGADHNSISDNHAESTSTTQYSSSFKPGARSGLGGRTHLFNNSKTFRTSLNQQTRSNQVGQLYSRNTSATSHVPPSAQSLDLSFDFVQNPTSEWSYVPNVINRTPDEVLALLEK
ncbi:unnamed protein product [Peronospora belbahrii]|nr:unnamed protein product [Peronospora belbahrii]